MSLRDELQSWLDEVTFRSVWPIIERALAAERGALKADIYDRLTQPLPIERFAKELHELDTDRSALDEMLAQARAEQIKLDAGIGYTAAAQFDKLCGRAVAAAIRGQKD